MVYQKKQSLLEPISIGNLHLNNRIVMASMTRGRVKNESIAPTSLQATYYEQRATAGLILTEGTWISKQAIGFIHVPGIFTEEQIAGWQLVTNSVHKGGGKIFLQLGHAGAMSHPDFNGGELPVGPSAVNPNRTVYPATGPKQTITPRALSTKEILQIIQDYRNAAQNAKKAGFDGIEIHTQHPSLISQFLSNYLNRRDDEYGGSLENKGRFLFEILNAVTEVWESKRVSVRINPFLSYSDSYSAPESTIPTYTYVAEKLTDYNLAFLHLIDKKESGLTKEAKEKRKIYKVFRDVYNGVLMANGGFTLEQANEIIESGDADLVSFGTYYISNPDLVYRFANNLPLTESNPATYFIGDEDGYTDYPAFDYSFIENK